MTNSTSMYLSLQPISPISYLFMTSPDCSSFLSTSSLPTFTPAYIFLGLFSLNVSLFAFPHPSLCLCPSISLYFPLCFIYHLPPSPCRPSCSKYVKIPLFLTIPFRASLWFVLHPFLSVSPAAFLLLCFLSSHFFFNFVPFLFFFFYFSSSFSPFFPFSSAIPCPS